MTVNFKPTLVFVVPSGGHTSPAKEQFGPQALVGIQSPANLTAPPASPTQEFFIQFLGSLTEDGDYTLIKNSSSIAGATVQAGSGFSHALDPTDFIAWPWLKVQVVDALGGNGVVQGAARTINGTLYVV